MRLRFSVVLHHLLWALAPALLLGTAAQADYVLAPGDRIAMEVVGVPDLGTIAMVDTEGRVNLPIVGRVSAAGRSAEALQSDIARLLSLKPIRIPGGGEEAWIQLDDFRIFVSVAEYRPVFATGDVRAGGEISFRPGMTARQVLVSAGGIGAVGGEVSTAEISQTRAERQLVADRLALARAEQSRLETALADLQMDQPQQEVEVQVWDQTADELRRLETSLAELRTNQTQDAQLAQVGEEGTAEEVWRVARNNLRHLRARTADLSLQRMKERLAVLEKLAEVDEAALQSYEAEFTRVTGLTERGIATANALAEAERGVLSISSRALETSAETHNLRVDISQAADRTQLEQTIEQIEILDALLRESVQVKEQEAQLKALDMQLTLLGVSAPAGDVQAVIYRGTGAQAQQLQVPLDAVVAPGDVISFWHGADK
ncbi:polysaccharide biosynthesis/export family protein [Aliiroseovarius crassostreae]|uniref:polysaccharide biosynthesis/export family protein n=1 Tax=Aliiroseovarius crassostreae TaxID=154981 RepID=UPI003C7AF40E